MYRSAATHRRSTFLTAMLAATIAVALPLGIGTAAASTAPPSASPAPDSSHDTNLVRDGSFEPPSVASTTGYNSYTTVDVGKLGAWEISAGGIDVINKSWGAPANGDQFVDLTGNTSKGPGTITQTLATSPGRAYRVEFYLAANPNGDPPIKNLQVQFGDVARDFTIDVRDHTGDDLGWAKTSFTADVCAGSSTTLALTSKTEGERGPYLDAVSVVDAGPAATCAGASAGAGGLAPWQIILLVVTSVAWLVSLFYLVRALVRRSKSRPGPVPSAT